MKALHEVVPEVAPRCLDVYIESLKINAGLLDQKGITANALRAAHWLAQGLHESGGGAIQRESGNYSAARIVEVFGPGRSSAAITLAEAERLAGDGEALFERAYGRGNPHMAQMLGNTQPGDGWRFRGNMFFQTTGREHHHRFGDKLGISFEAHPEEMARPKYAVAPAILEWDAGRLNALADANDVRGITRKINGGYNGLASREAWFAKVYAALRDDPDGPEPWQKANPLPSTTALQSALNALGADPKLKVDGKYGPATAAAVSRFQQSAGIAVDGIAGPVTHAAISNRLSAFPDAA